VEKLAGRNVLVVEDEPLVALDITTALQDAGAHVVTAHSLADATAVMERIKIEAAVVDIKLGAEDVSPLCRHLSQRDIRFVFYSGYKDPPVGWDAVPVVEKPARPQQIIDAVEMLLRSFNRAA
jgi:DNA-binding response OmpR family regulator